MKRSFIIAGALAALVIIGLGVAAYFYFFSGARVSVSPEGSVGLPVAERSGAGSTGSATGDGADKTSSPVAVSARLVKVSAGPVVPGMVVIGRKAVNASSSPDVAVRYIERQSGNVFSYLVREKALTRTSNRTVPGIRSASWLPDGSTAFVRYLSDADPTTVNTYALRANGSEGFFLQQNLADIAVSSTSVLALVSGTNGSTASLLRTDGTRLATAFVTPMSSLRVSFAGKSRYLAVTRPAAALQGSAFLVDAGRFSHIIGPRNGLSVLPSRSGKWILASYAAGSGMRIELINATNGEALTLPVKTLADKCVWTADDSAVYCGVPVDPPANSTYPDDWYQGAAHFSDRIWKIEVANRYAQMLLDFSQEASGELDAEALAIDQLGSVLVFVNRNDGSLWSYSL